MLKKEKKLRNILNAAGLRFIQTNISFEPLRRKLPREIELVKQELFEKIHTNPREAFETIKCLIKKYPHEPMLTNWRIAAYQNFCDDEKEISHFVEEDYKNFPDYLFARCAQAQICINTGRFEEVPKIFNNKFLLDDLYPTRNTFHVTEVLAFYSIIGQYFCCTKDFDQANIYLKIIEGLDNQSISYKLLFSAILKHFLTESCSNSNGSHLKKR